MSGQHSPAEGPRLGVDVGGTFTDLVLATADGGVAVAKVPSTPQDQAEGVLDGVGRLELDAATLARFAHGTTVATNAVLERTGARTVLVTTAGFRDLLEIGRQDRPSLYDFWADRTPPLVPAALVVEATERISAEGEVLIALDDPAAVAEAVAALEPEAVVISLLFAFLDDRHERAIADALADAGVDVPISRSSDVLPVFREYERTSTTTLNAYVAPSMGSYLATLAQRLAADGMTCTVEVMRSGGGTFAAGLAGRYPVNTLLSGPAAGVWGAAAVGRFAGHDDLIAFDMGGTSTDVTLIAGGEPQTTAEGAIDGLPFAVRTTDIHTVGSGGGSIAWRDDGGALRIGPRSSGARPGPACYGFGGTEPTVTDANLHLGHLDPDTRLGGHMALDADAARDAIAALADQLGMDVDDCAAGILRVVEAQMVKALRVVSVERGQDPREFTLLPFGGAGPLHQAAIARELGCERVLVPPHPGVLSALGLLAAPVVIDAVRTHLVTTDSADPDTLTAIWDELVEHARGLIDEQGVTPERVGRSCDLRYRGQAFELEVELTDDELTDGRPDLDGLAAGFHDAHRERYGYAQPDETVEVVNLRVRAEGPTPEVPLHEVDDGNGADGAIVATHPVVVDGETRDCPVYDRDVLGHGDNFEGPAIVSGVDSTCFVAAWQTVAVDPFGNLVITAADQEGSQ